MNICSLRCERIHKQTQRVKNWLVHRHSSFLLSSLPSWPCYTYQFLFLSGFHHSVLSLFLSLSVWLTLYYGSLSNMSADTCPLLSASVYFHPLLSSPIFFFSHHPSILVCQLFSPSMFQFPPSLPPSVTLPELFARARAHRRTFPVAGTQSQSGIPWMRLAGLFEPRGAALSERVRLCI